MNIIIMNIFINITISRSLEDTWKDGGDTSREIEPGTRTLAEPKQISKSSTSSEESANSIKSLKTELKMVSSSLPKNIEPFCPSKPLQEVQPGFVLPDPGSSVLIEPGSRALPEPELNIQMNHPVNKGSGAEQLVCAQIHAPIQAHVSTTPSQPL